MKQILLIEDNAIELRLLQEVLKGSILHRCELTAVQRLRDGIALLETQTFDLILLDLSLPDSVGLTSLDRLLAIAPQLPIVVLTNTDDDELALEAVRHGAQDYLVKRHMNQDSLVRSIRYAIERKQGSEALREANEVLELRVQERTAALESANRELTAEIERRQQMQAQFLQAQRLESLGTLASGIAHDLNNILTPILGVSKLLPTQLVSLDEPSQAQTRQMLTLLESSANRGAALVKQILSFAHGIEGEQTDLHLKPLLLEIEQIIQQTLPKSISFVRNVPMDLWTVLADATQIHQVVMNLCVNARDAMPEGGMLTLHIENCSLTPAETQIHLDAKVGPYVRLTVADTGTGMTPEVLDRIFDPFFTTKPVGKGTGLGLSAVLGIVKRHGGFLDVQTVLGKGSQFRMFLPAQQTPSVPTVPSPEDFDGQGALILVVDDEAAIRSVLQTALEQYNYRVMTACNGMEASVCFEHHPEIQGVLMDLMMPEMDGFSSISALRQMRHDLYIVAMTGLPSAEVIVQLRQQDVYTCLSKPFSVPELLHSFQALSASPLSEHF